MKHRLINLFKELISIDSVSGEEQDISDYVMKFLKKLDLEPIRDKYNMIYCRIGDQPNPSLFCAHMDTVEPGRGIEVIEKDGLLISNGKTILGGDNKVALAAMLYSLKELLHSEKEPNIELLISVREETNSGIQQFDTNKIESKVGFVFDLADNLEEVVTSAPSIQDFEITIKGKASHASRPEKGINVLDVLNNAKIRLGRIDPDTTFNIGKISGGDATNTVPSNLSLKGDIRSTDHKKLIDYRNQVEKALNTAASSLGAEVTFDWKPYCYAYKLAPENENYLSLLDFYRGMSYNLQGISTTGGSDAGFLNYKGIETFCMGYGVENIHTIDERIQISKFQKLEQIISQLMLNFEG